MAHRIVPVVRNDTIVVVPDEVAKEVEEAYAYQVENPGHVFLVEGFDSADEVETWVKQVKSYLVTREAGTLKFQKLRTDSLPDTSIRFTLVHPDDWKPRGRAAQSEPAAE